MVIPKLKRKRREVRKLPATRSNEFLVRYWRGEPVTGECPLKKTLAGLGAGSSVSS